MTLELFLKHPYADAYRVGGAYQPYAVIAVDKRFTDGELAAEYWDWVAQMEHLQWSELSSGIEISEEGWDSLGERSATLYRFATADHASDTNYE